MDIRAGTFDFPRLADTGPQSAETTVSFPRSVLRVAAGIAGYTSTFEGEDHHFGRMEVEVSARIDPANDTRVIVSGTFGLRDWSGEFDDDYSGSIDFVVLADLVNVSPPQPNTPRGDLIVVDAEISQVIQHFRASQHLSNPNVFPDNSIRLVANKPTAVRLYVDYDASSGLPAIASLSGTLEVIRAGVTETITPLQSIVPRRDAQIDRRLRQHTLIFIIPETSSRGDVTIRARVFNAADSTQFSATFERTLTFGTMPALPVLAVGINYTGPDVIDGATPEQLAAPDLAGFIGTLALTEKLFPIPQVTLTSFITINYDEEVESDIGEGCDKLGDLLDTVRELRGDSNDIVLGLFGPGLDTGSVGGCGGNGAAVGMVNAGGTAAHELAHAVGRRHAPCDNVTRCATPANTDDDYPQYSVYDSDSIGEFGIDTANGVIKDPSIAHDIMGYSPNRWISPYTYKALMARIPQVIASGPGLAAGDEDRGDWIRRKQPKLFLNLTIDRSRAVSMCPAFVYPAYPQACGQRRTPFTAVLQDRAGRTLRQMCLSDDEHGGPCSCGPVHWPVHVRQAIPFDPEATRFVIYEGDQAIYQEHIGPAPEVSVQVCEAADQARASLLVTWQARAKGRDEDKLWYLVQWRDAAGTWRGLAPRTQAECLTVPKAVFREQQVIAIRVLASSGIATGVGLWEGTPGTPVPD